MSLLWDGDIHLSTVVIGGGIFHGGMESCSQEGRVGVANCGLRIELIQAGKLSAAPVYPLQALSE